MQTLKTMHLSIYSLIILMLVYINAYDNTQKVFLQYKIFTKMLIANIGLIIIIDESNMDILRAVVDRIDISVNKFNMNSGKPYKINFSIGYDVYDFQQEFIDYNDKFTWRDRICQKIKMTVG